MKGLELGDYLTDKVPLASNITNALALARSGKAGQGAGDFLANLFDIKTPKPDVANKQAKGKAYGDKETKTRDAKLRQKYDLSQ